MPAKKAATTKATARRKAAPPPPPEPQKLIRVAFTAPDLQAMTDFLEEHGWEHPIFHRLRMRLSSFYLTQEDE